jgi:dTDP-L-rhamnose 4-epimerase
MRVLITGGAGFIGSHLVNQLVNRGDDVVVVDNLDAQSHPSGTPDWIDLGAQYHWCDFRATPDSVLDGTYDAVVHLAAATGTGQSMYEGASYTRANAELTAHLADLLVAGRLQTGRVVFASSRAVYGEGTRQCGTCGKVRPGARSAAAATAREWEPPCPKCGSTCTWTPTQEDDEPRPLSVYGATKLFGEIVLDLTAGTSTPPVTSLRFFNIYGSRQSPANPYVGVASTFAALALARKEITIFEDGQVLRDFLHVKDAVGAIMCALDRHEPLAAILNIGSGSPLSLLDLARSIAATSGESLDDIGYKINGLTRMGDLRACIANVDRARDELEWTPSVGIDDGVAELLRFIEGEPMSDPSVANNELERHGLLLGRR